MPADERPAASNDRRHPRAIAALLVIAVVVAAVVVAAEGRLIPSGWPLGPRLGDPALVAGDPRFASCDVAPAPVWIAFPIARARDVTLHFPGWSDGIPELQVDDPAFVVLSQGMDVATTGLATGPQPLSYQLCIAVGQGVDAVIHHYGWTRFDTVVPNIGGPSVTLP